VVATRSSATERPFAGTAKDQQLLLEYEILRDRRAHATGAHSFAVMTAK